MQVSEIMTKDPVKINLDTSIQEAAQTMKELDCGFLPIGSNGKLEGVLTDRDIVIRAIAEGKSLQTTKVKDILTDNVLYCSVDDDIRDAAERMRDEQVYRLVVVNNEEDKQLEGILTLGDIARQTDDAELVGETAEKVCERTME
jgi:CBS domain-containing protein